MSKFEAGMEAMVDMYIYETTTLLEQLDQILMKTESMNEFDDEDINEIFRIMHTIKGSSAMMGLQNMSSLAHAIEDMFFIIREDKPVIRQIKELYEIVFSASDLLKAEIDLLQEDEYAATDFSDIIAKIELFARTLKVDADEDAAILAESNNSGNSDEQGSAESKGMDGVVSIKVYFEDDCKMENLRALLIINKIKDQCEFLEYIPDDIEGNGETAKQIIESGFIIKFKAYNGKTDDVIREIEEALNVKSYEILDAPKRKAPEPEIIENKDTQPMEVKPEEKPKDDDASKKNANGGASVDQINNMLSQGKGGVKQSLISVNLNKLDQLLDMVGEIVITEAMVTANPDLKGLQLDNFQKAARQLRKLTDELQDIVMSIRMVPLSGAFNKMTRIVRDMKVKLGKEVDLAFEGEDTEVDKSIIDNLNDPLMHMVRNAVDHGIEATPEERIAAGKPEKGTVTLSAYNSSGEVIIVVSDDGYGIDPQKVLAKAQKNGLLSKAESEYSDKEIYNMIMLPGFSTNEVVTEYSGRGVGMDVVRKNIEKIGGTVSVDSKYGEGTNFIIKIPLSLAIVDGMEVSVGSSIFTIPINSIKESFKLKENQLILDTSGREMIMIRGKCYPLIRLYDIYGLTPNHTDLYEGIILLVEAEGRRACIFADELIGEQQVVVKPFSPMLNNFNVKQNGMAGCTILGDGSITIILDTNNIISNF